MTGVEPASTLSQSVLVAERVHTPYEPTSFDSWGDRRDSNPLLSGHNTQPLPNGNEHHNSVNNTA